MSFEVEIFIEDDHDGLEILRWAKEYCPSYITNCGTYGEYDTAIRYQFYFGSDKDALAFTLKWL